MGKHILYKSAAFIASAGIASGALANPIAPWHNPSTPQSYSPMQRWGTVCAVDEHWEKRIKKKARKVIEPEKTEDGGLLFSTKSWHQRTALIYKVVPGSFEFLTAKIKDGKVEYGYTIYRGAWSYIYQSHPSLNISSLDVKIGDQLVSFGNSAQFQSMPKSGTNGIVATYTMYATSTIPIDERLVDYVAKQPDSTLVASTLWMHDGVAVGCPNRLHPAEFRAIRDAATKAVAG